MAKNYRVMWHALKDAIRADMDSCAVQALHDDVPVDEMFKLRGRFKGLSCTNERMHEIEEAAAAGAYQDVPEE